MKIFNIDGKDYYRIVRPSEDVFPQQYLQRVAFDKLEAAMKDDETWKEFLNSDAASRHNMAELINDIALGFAIMMFIPKEPDELNGSSCEDLRAEFEPQYENGAPF